MRSSSRHYLIPVFCKTRYRRCDANRHKRSVPRLICDLFGMWLSTRTIDRFYHHAANRVVERVEVLVEKGDTQ